MEFIKTNDSSTGVQIVFERIQKELSSAKKVLWLLCGGSNIHLEVEILKKLHSSAKIENLALLLMDERFGPVGHKDSNWQQLIDAGIDLDGLYALPVITSSDKSLEQTVADYVKLSEVAISEADKIIGLFGIGDDGHTAGMLPGTPAVGQTSIFVVGYDSPPFRRITMTRNAISQVDVAYVFAFGDGKRSALLDLEANIKPFVELPSNIFWELPEAYVYNDQIGEKL